MRPRLSLKGRGLQILAQREHSRSELRRKLLTHARVDATEESNPTLQVEVVPYVNFDGLESVSIVLTGAP